jgi:hypothetical protein
MKPVEHVLLLVLWVNVLLPGFLKAIETDGMFACQYFKDWVSSIPVFH